MKEILKKLARPLPPELIKSKPVSNSSSKEVCYLEWYTAADLLDQNFPEWNMDIIEVGEISGFVFVRLAITINNVRRENIGFENSVTDSYGDPFSNAYAMAFKRTCAMFGLGRYLYKGGETVSLDHPVELKPATQKQVAAITKLQQDERLTPEERMRLKVLLGSSMSKEKASEILDHFYGASEKRDGQWIKITAGVLGNRKQEKAA